MAFPENMRLIDPDEGSERIVHLNQVPTGIYIFSSTGSYLVGPWATIEAWNHYIDSEEAPAPEHGEAVVTVQDGRIARSYGVSSGGWPAISEEEGPPEVQRPRRRLRLALVPSEERYLEAVFAGRVTLPEGSKVVNAFHDHHTQSVGFLVQNEDFKVTPEGCEPERLLLIEEVARDGSYSLTFEA